MRLKLLITSFLLISSIGYADGLYDHTLSIVNLDTFISSNDFTLTDFNQVPSYHHSGYSLFRGSGPLTDADFKYLKKIGIKTLLTLQMLPWQERQERAMAQKYGMKFVVAPIGASPIKPTKMEVQRALIYIKDKNLDPMYIHCSLGKHRTGMVIALHRIFDEGMPLDVANKEMIDNGFTTDLFTRVRLKGLVDYFNNATAILPAK